MTQINSYSFSWLHYFAKLKSTVCISCSYILQLVQSSLYRIYTNKNLNKGRLKKKSVIELSLQ